MPHLDLPINSSHIPGINNLRNAINYGELKKSLGGEFWQRLRSFRESYVGPTGTPGPDFLKWKNKEHKSGLKLMAKYFLDNYGCGEMFWPVDEKARLHNSLSYSRPVDHEFITSTIIQLLFRLNQQQYSTKRYKRKKTSPDDNPRRHREDQSATSTKSPAKTSAKPGNSKVAISGKHGPGYRGADSITPGLMEATASMKKAGQTNSDPYRLPESPTPDSHAGQAPSRAPTVESESSTSHRRDPVQDHSNATPSQDAGQSRNTVINIVRKRIAKDHSPIYRNPPRNRKQPEHSLRATTEALDEACLSPWPESEETDLEDEDMMSDVGMTDYMMMDDVFNDRLIEAFEEGGTSMSNSGNSPSGAEAQEIPVAPRFELSSAELHKPGYMQPTVEDEEESTPLQTAASTEFQIRSPRFASKSMPPPWRRSAEQEPVRPEVPPIEPLVSASGPSPQAAPEAAMEIDDNPMKAGWDLSALSAPWPDAQPYAETPPEAPQNSVPPADHVESSSPRLESKEVLRRDFSESQGSEPAVQADAKAASHPPSTNANFTFVLVLSRSPQWRAQRWVPVGKFFRKTLPELLWDLPLDFGSNAPGLMFRVISPLLRIEEAVAHGEDETFAIMRKSFAGQIGKVIREQAGGEPLSFRIEIEALKEDYLEAGLKDGEEDDEGLA